MSAGRQAEGKRSLMNGNNVQQDSASNEVASLSRRIFPGVHAILIRSFMDRAEAARRVIVDSDLFSVRILLLAMPLFGIMIQCALFLFGIPCSPFPMWISFLLFSLLALLIHWKRLVCFWGLIFLALLLTAFTFSYIQVDAESYHIPMQLLLKEGWNPVFDSTLEKIGTIADTSTFWDKHTLFLPKTVALCGAMVSLASGLWIADTFLGYILFFVLFRTSYVFAKKTWDCNVFCCILFAAALSIRSKNADYLFSGMIDFHIYAAFVTALLSLLLYLQHHRIRDFILAILATAICSTTKTTGLVNCVFLWCGFGVLSWKHKETYPGIIAVTILVAWIGISPLVTSWIQYGSPFYPSMTFDPKIATVDITADFAANADGERMGYVARFVYAWVSPALAAKACALYYHKADFAPQFYVTGGVGGFGTSLNLLLWCSIVFLLLAKKNLVSFVGLFIMATLVLCPVKYIGYGRYFLQACAIIPLGLYQFCFCPPDWLPNKMKKPLRICLSLAFGLVALVNVTLCVSYQIRNIIAEGKCQKLLASFQKEDAVFAIPQNTEKAFMLSRRLACSNVKYSFGQQKLDFQDEASYPHFIRFYNNLWGAQEEYRLHKKPSRILKLLDIFKIFPSPIFYRTPNDPESPIPAKTDPDGPV